MDLAAPHVEIDRVERERPGETLGQPRNLESGLTSPRIVYEQLGFGHLPAFHQ